MQSQLRQFEKPSDTKLVPSRTEHHWGWRLACTAKAMMGFGESRWSALVVLAGSVGFYGCAEQPNAPSTAFQQESESPSIHQDAGTEPSTSTTGTPPAPRTPEPPASASTQQQPHPLTEQHSDDQATVAESAVEPQSQTRAAESADLSPPSKPLVTHAGEAAEMLDLSVFPPYKADRVSTQTPLSLDYVSNSDAGTALQHHQQALQAAGWKLAETGARTDPGNYTSRQFQKSNHFVELAINEFDPQMVGVTLKHLGNVDARTLPVGPDVEAIDEYSSAAGAYYHTTRTVKEVAGYCRREMAALGWLEYKNVDAFSELPYETDGARVVPFVQSGVTCYLLVSPPSQYTDGKTSVAYFLTGLIADGLTVPPQANQIQLARNSGHVSYAVGLPLAEAQAELERDANGRYWVAEQSLRESKPRHAKSVFQTPLGRLVTAEFREQGFEDTRVQLRSFEANQLDSMLAAVASSKPQAAPNPNQKDGSTESGSSTPTPDLASSRPGAQRSLSGALSALDFPVPPGAKIVSHVAPLSIQSDLSAKDIADFYDKTLPSLGFENNTDVNTILPEVQNLLYTNNTNSDLQLAIVIRESNGDFPSVFVMGSGIEFSSEEESTSQLQQVQSTLENLAIDVLGADLAAEVPELTEERERIAERVGEIDEEGMPTEEPNGGPTLIVDAQLAGNATNRVRGSASKGSTTVTLNHAVAYQWQDQGVVQTTLMLTDRELPQQELLLQLKETAEISLFDLSGRMPQYIEITWSKDSQSCNLYIGGASVSGIGDKLNIAIDANQGWVRGKVETKEPHDVFGETLTFSATLDIAALNPKNLTAETLAAASRPLQEADGLILPASADELYRTGSAYSSSAQALVTELSLEQVMALYRQEMPALAWNLQQDSLRREEDKAEGLEFTNSEAELRVFAKETEDGVELEVIRREVKQAKADGLLPVEGKGKLIFGNAFDKQVVVIIGKSEYKLPAGKGAEDPQDALQYDVAPGNYKLLIKVPGKEDQRETIDVRTGTTWGLIVIPSGDTFTDQLF